MTIATVTLTIPGLTNIVLTVRAESSVREVERQVGSLYWIGLEVDDTFIPLVLWKHLVSNKEMRTALDQALAQVKAAIAALQPEPPLPAMYRTEIVWSSETKDYALLIEGQCIGYAPTNYLGEQKINAHIMKTRYAA